MRDIQHPLGKVAGVRFGPVYELREGRCEVV